MVRDLTNFAECSELIHMICQPIQSQGDMLSKLCKLKPHFHSPSTLLACHCTPHLWFFTSFKLVVAVLHSGLVKSFISINHTEAYKSFCCKFPVSAKEPDVCLLYKVRLWWAQATHFHSTTAMCHTNTSEPVPTCSIDSSVYSCFNTKHYYLNMTEFWKCSDPPMYILLLAYYIWVLHQFK